MNGGLASPTPRRLAAGPTARKRPEPARAPERQPAPRLVPRRTEAPTMRERLAAAAAPRAADLHVVPAVAPPGVAEEARAAAIPEPTATPAAAAPTTRERIVNRALAEREAAPVSTEPSVEAAAEPAAAVVVPIAPLRDRRRREGPTAPPPPPEGPLAPVVALHSPAAARAPPPIPAVVVSAPEAEAAPEPTARAPPAASAAEPAPAVAGVSAREKAAAPAREEAAAPAGEGAVPAAPAAEVALAGPAPAAAVTTTEAPPAGEPTATEPEPVPAAEPEAPPRAEPGAEPVPEAAAQAAAATAAVPTRIPRNPEDEPGFQTMKAQAQRAAARTKRHQTGREAADIAQGASAPEPQTDVQSQAARERVEQMGDKEPGRFDVDEFTRQIHEKVKGMAPPETLEEADEFENTGKAAGATSFMQQLVQGGRAGAEREIKDTTATPPDASGKEPKDVSKMVHDPRGVRLPVVDAAAAMPGPRPAASTDLSSGPLEVEAKLAEANLTEQQLVQANEPEFTAALDARREVQEHAATAPGEYRVQEELALTQGRAEVENLTAAELEGMLGARRGTVGEVVGEKDATKTKDEQLRNDIHQAILGIHEQTQADVMKLLETLDTTVETMFTDGEKAARDEFERYVDEKMTAYKADRYSGVFGPGRWLWDKAFDLPDEVNAFYKVGRQNYIDAMDRVIAGIAVFVGVMLGLAKVRIEIGRAQVRAYVQQLDDSVRGLGNEVATDLENRFDQLDSDVDAKRDELVDTIARKYVDARDDLDERIEELKEANKGLVSKAIDFVVSVAKTVYELTKLLVRVLLKAASAIGDIVAHPIRFLENLIGAIKGGLDRFVERIGDHLQNSLLELLFGELGKAGITMPPALDFAGILDLVLQVLGLAYTSVRERVVARFGEAVVTKMEETVDIFKTLVKEGPAGLWELIREKLADLEELVVGKIKTYIVERVVRAGITYIVALLNPAAAFIKACQTIYQIVTFIVERAKQIADFVDAVLDSITAIAQGNIGGAIERVERALAGGLSFAVGFLARLANLGALSEKVRSIIDVVRKPITRAVDAIVFGAAQIYRRTVGRATDWAKGKVEAGKEWAADKVEAGKELLKGKTADGGEEHVAPEPAPRPVPAGELLQVDEGLSLADGGHRLQSGRDPAELVLRSGPILISTVSDPTLQAHYQAYVQAAATYTANLAAFDDPQRALQLGGSTEQPRARARLGKAAVDRAVAAIKSWVDQNGVPPTDAPGLGDVRPYALQQKRFNDVPIWRMEAEHVIPNGYFNALLEGMRLTRIETNDEYQQMSTVLLYERAAEWKTSGAGADEGDVSIIRQIKAWASRYFTELHSEGGGGGNATENLYHLMSGFETRLDDVQSRTLRMVDAEQRQNGTHRGHAPRASMREFFAPRVKDVRGRQLRLFVVVLEDRLEKSVRRGRRGF